MREIFDTIPGRRFIEDVQMNGAVNGNAVIANRAEFVLNGVVDGNLYLEKDAKATVNGVVKGDVINEGGRLKIYGMVNGKIIHRGGKVYIHPRALVSGGVSKE